MIVKSLQANINSWLGHMWAQGLRLPTFVVGLAFTPKVSRHLFFKYMTLDGGRSWNTQREPNHAREGEMQSHTGKPLAPSGSRIVATWSVLYLLALNLFDTPVNTKKLRQKCLLAQKCLQCYSSLKHLRGPKGSHVLIIRLNCKKITCDCFKACTQQTLKKITLVLHVHVCLYPLYVHRKAPGPQGSSTRLGFCNFGFRINPKANPNPFCDSWWFYCKTTTLWNTDKRFDFNEGLC